MFHWIKATLLFVALVASAAAQQPTFETRTITDNVYIFRYVAHQSMFVVTPEGVIATDPIAYLRPQAAKAYIDEIRKITAAPIKYVVYSHHHYDHAVGGSPFKDLGATFIAHRNAKMHLEQLKFADIVMPDVLVDDKYVIELGGIRVELYYVGRNHSDNASASTGGAGINHVIPTNTRNLPASDSQNPAACPSRRGSEPAT